MSQTAVTHGTPDHPAELPLNYVPFDATERDFREPTTGRERRLRMVRVVSHDQNSLIMLIDDLGPPTGEEGVYIPCHGANEMVYVYELLEQAKRDRASRKAAQRLRQATFHEKVRLGLLEEAEMGTARNAARSAFGPLYNIQRSN